MNTEVPVMYRICPTCGGSGQVPEDRFDKDVRSACGRACPDCRPLRVVVADVGALRDPIERLMVVCKAYEKWEADLILSDEAWDGGRRDLPKMTDELWDQLL